MDNHGKKVYVKKRSVSLIELSYYEDCLADKVLTDMVETYNRIKEKGLYSPESSHDKIRLDILSNLLTT